MNMHIDTQKHGPWNGFGLRTRAFDAGTLLVDSASPKLIPEEWRVELQRLGALHLVMHRNLRVIS